MDKNEIVKKIQEEDDYIRSPKFSNSIAKFLSKHPDGVEDNIIARLLMVSEERVKGLYEEAIAKLRESMSDFEE